MKKNIITVLRWVAVLPAAILGFLVAYLLALLFGNFIKWYGNTFFLFISNAIGGAGWTLAGTAIAPSKKRLVAVVLSTIGCCIVVASFIYTYLTGTLTWQNIVGGLITSAGIVVGAFIAYDAYDSFD